MPAINVRLMKRDDQEQVADFSSGELDLDEYLQLFAWSSQQAGGPMTYLAFDDATNSILGYYSLVAGSVPAADAPDRVTKGMGGYSAVGSVHLARFAIDVRFQRQRKGFQLLIHALATATASPVGFRIIELHAMNEGVRDFYMKAGFEQMDPGKNPDDLFMLLKDVRATLRQYG